MTAPVRDGGFGADGPSSAIEDGDGVKVEIADSRPARALVRAHVFAAGADGQQRVLIEERDR